LTATLPGYSTLLYTSFPVINLTDSSGRVHGFSAVGRAPATGPAHFRDRSENLTPPAEGLDIG